MVRDVAWNGRMWVAVGSGTNSIAYSYDGIYWTGVTDSSSSIFVTYGRGVAWNGRMWVAVGGAYPYTIAYSYDGIHWTGVTGSVSSIFGAYGYGVAWNGRMWVAVGDTTNSIAYSYDGIHWTGLGTNIFDTSGQGVAWSGEQPHEITFPIDRMVAVGDNSLARQLILFIPMPAGWERCGMMRLGFQRLLVVLLLTALSGMGGCGWH